MCLLLWRHLNFNFMCNGGGDLTLQREHVTQIAFVGLGPEMAVGRRIDQLCSDPYLVSGSSN